ncbi:proton-conducting transporter membrane subunit [Rhizobium calliandrae]|uniref:Proton-conducting transporter membrane subunit n=1 Tax=Rhizobium calliandrae TaxID=1312182 RepID=A0ABT7K6Z2_9HYPH|nr:proton-conducting transporter membrane subunit [Rhizobium calliandrae]MDL2404371.1 proton-conducting transporter membrane subunit [Rhizobium calliandrae]
MESVTGLTFLALCLPLLGAITVPTTVRYLGHNAAWPLSLFPALAFLHFLGFLPTIAAGHNVQEGLHWVPSLNLRFSWLLDGLSLTFALMITGIGTLIVHYAGGYLNRHADQSRFFSFIFLFMGSMLGLVASDSFLTLFVFWELTLIASFLLIGFTSARPRGALPCRRLPSPAEEGCQLLAGLSLIWQVTGAADMSSLLRAGGALRESPVYLATLVLILGGAFTKSAQFLSISGC